MRDIRIIIVLSACVGVSSAALAGDLNPPAGPVEPSMKTLEEVEPRIAINAVNTPGGANTVYRIDEPGSYYLTENLLGEAGKGGINIRASGVTIDLNGFALIGTAGSSNGIYLGINELSDIHVLDGTIQKFGESGIDFSNSSGEGLLIRNVHSSLNGMNGILWNAGGVVEGCSSSQNGEHGFFCPDGASVVRGCSSINNGESGMVIGNASTIVACATSNNTLAGISTGNGCVIADSASRDNGTAGFEVNNGGALRACAASGNGTDGFSLDVATTAEGCSATANAQGFFVDAGSQLTGCNATDNTGNGIEAISQAALLACTAVANDTGIVAGAGSTVEGCSASLNEMFGISAGDECSVVGNTCTRNGLGMPNTAGITAGARCIVEGNRVIENRFGILTSGGDGIVSRNFAWDNVVNYDLDGQDDIGPIGTAKTSTSPWANISQ